MLLDLADPALGQGAEGEYALGRARSYGEVMAAHRRAARRLQQAGLLARGS